MGSMLKSCTNILCVCAAMSGGFLVYTLYKNKYNSHRKAAKGRCLTPAEIPHLPPEIFTEILSYLGVKDFLRCRSVQKQWNALMEDRQFATKFMERRSKTYRINYLFPVTELVMKKGISRYLATCDGLDLMMHTSFHYTPFRMSESSILETHSLFIRNTALRQKLHLPKPYVGDVAAVYGFTFIPSTSEYKVVSIYLEDQKEKCAVLTLVGAKHRWRPLDLPMSDNQELEYDLTQVVQTGVDLHCIRVVEEDSFSSYYEVRSLDLESECFTVTKVYKEFIAKGKEHWAMKWKESLAFVYMDQGYELNVLVFEDYKKQKWGEKFIVSLQFMKEKAIREFVPEYAEHGLVWFCINDEKKIAFDLATKRIVHTIFPIANTWLGGFGVFCRVQSVVTLEGMQYEKDENPRVDYTRIIIS